MIHLLSDLEYSKFIRIIVPNFEFIHNINDLWSVLMVKAEILKYLMHFLDWTSDQIVACVIMYL